MKWKTVKMILILEIMLKLKPKQCDPTVFFLNSNLGEDKQVYAEMRLNSEKRQLYEIQENSPWNISKLADVLEIYK